MIAFALVAGVFLTFSDFVMRSLAATQAAGGIEAMQHINRKVFRTLFMVLLIGMAIVSPLMAAAAFWQVSGPASAWIIAAAVTYVIGTFGVTVVFNVPMNERLDRMAHDSAIAAALLEPLRPGMELLEHCPHARVCRGGRLYADGSCRACLIVQSQTL